MPWTAVLTRPITLADGTKVVTFKYALGVLMRDFVGASPSAVEPTIGLLIKADATRKRSDIDQASDHLEQLFREQQLID